MIRISSFNSSQLPKSLLLHSPPQVRFHCSQSLPEHEQNHKKATSVLKKTIIFSFTAATAVTLPLLCIRHLKRVKERKRQEEEEQENALQRQYAEDFLAKSDEIAMGTAFRGSFLAILFLPSITTLPITLLPFCPSQIKDLWWAGFYQALNTAGPVWIKFCQWLSTRKDLIPSSICERLAKLQSDCTIHPFEDTKKELELLLHGDELSSKFSDIESNPIASGAVAQVHKATLKNKDGSKGETVAIKVLHPLAPSLVAADLRLMRRFAVCLSSLPGFNWIKLTTAVDEFSMRMISHLDLRIEARNLRRFRKNFGSFDSSSIQFPEPLNDLVSRTVLVESFVDGVLLSKFITQQQKRSVKNQESKNVGLLILNTFFKMTFVDNFVHMDLHPGNIFVHTNEHGNIIKGELNPPIFNWWSKILPFRNCVKHNPKPSLTLIDAGLVCSVTSDWQKNMLTLCNLVASGKYSSAAELLIDRGPCSKCNESQRRKFIQGMSVIFSDFSTHSIEELPLCKMSCSVAELAQKCDVQLEGKFVGLVVSAMVLDGVGRQLGANINLVKAAMPWFVPSLLSKYSF